MKTYYIKNLRIVAEISIKDNQLDFLSILCNMYYRCYVKFESVLNEHILNINH